MKNSSSGFFKPAKDGWFFGEVPSHWLVAPFKYVCKKFSIYGANIPAEQYSIDGIRFLRTTDIRDDGKLNPEGVYVPAELVENYILTKGDFLISRSGTLGRVYIHEEENGLCAYAGYLVRYVLKKTQNPRFFFYLTKTHNFQEWLSYNSIEATIGNVNGEKYANLLVPIPSIEVQNTIVAFLDLETNRVDRLIQVKERLLDLLSEKRHVLITQAVTRGLNFNVPLKASNIDWLGDVPEHWQVERTRWLFYERNERSETGEEEMLSVSHLTGVTSRSEKEVNMFEAESNEGYKVCYPGDLVINTLWAWMGAMGVSPLHGIVSPAYHVYTPSDRVNSSYIDAIVRLPIFASEVTRYSKGVWSSRLRLYPEGFYEVYLPVPPLEEQQSIVNHIKQELNKLSALQKATEQTIQLLKERRSALITAAVTGHIKLMHHVN